MMSLFTITGMAIIRYLSVVLLQRSWHSPIKHSIWLSRSVWSIFSIAIALSAPPLIGFGKYVKDSSFIWYYFFVLQVQKLDLFSVLWHINLSFLWIELTSKLEEFSLTFPNFSCAPSWSTKSSLGIIYNWFIITFGFFLPTMVICVCSPLTIRKIYQVNCIYWNERRE